MNAPLDQDLIAIPRADALQVYTTPGAIEPYLDRVRTEVEAFKALGQTVATAKGRQAIKSFAFRIARTRAALEAFGKSLADEVKAIPKKVDATRRAVKESLEDLEEQVRGPLTAWEDAEKARVEGHEAALAAIAEPLGYGMIETAAEIRARLEFLRNPPARDWQEYAERAAQALAAEVERAETFLAAAEKREAEAAELARLRAESEARQAREREEQARRDAEERDRRIAEEAAAAERAKVEAERQKAEQAAADAIARAEKAERDREMADRAAALAAAKAAEKAEADRLAAIEDERRRAAEAKADEKHRASVNNAAKAGLVAAGLSEQAAVAAVTAIAKGDVPRVRISY